MLQNLLTIVIAIAILIALSFIRAKYKIHRFLADTSAIFTIYDSVFKDPLNFILPQNGEYVKIECGRYHFTFSNFQEGKLKFEKIMMNMLEYYENFNFIFKIEPALLEYEQKILNILLEIQRNDS